MDQEKKFATATRFRCDKFSLPYNFSLIFQKFNDLVKYGDPMGHCNRFEPTNLQWRLEWENMILKH